MQLKTGLSMKTKVIAEIGINHNGCVETAKKLIDVAVIAGCHYVKFQKRNPDLCVPENQKNKPKSTPWGEMTYLEYKHKQNLTTTSTTKSLIIVMIKKFIALQVFGIQIRLISCISLQT
jgi:sialic acid synthase SpsE